MNNNEAAPTTTKNLSGDLCQHGAYADLCITCHPTDDDIVTAAIALARKEEERATRERILAAMIADGIIRA